MNLMTVFFLQAPPAAGANGSMMWIMLIAMIAIMYFFMIRPQNKKQKEIANFRKSLQVNQKVITAGGIHGVVKEINDNDIILEIASGVKIRIDKNSIFAAAADVNGNQAAKKGLSAQRQEQGVLNFFVFFLCCQWILVAPNAE